MLTITVTKPLTHGAHVEALQRLLAKRGFYRGAFDGIYGTVTAQAVYRAKLLLGYQKPDHAAGDLLTAYLNGVRKPTAAMAKRAAVRKPIAKVIQPGTTTAPAPSAADLLAKLTDARETAVMRLLLANEPHVHYRQARPMVTRTIDTIAELELAIRRPEGIALDCSESATLIARLSGQHDPNGNDFNGSGYTGTILDKCKPIRKADLEVGDLSVFGPGTGHHVVTVLQPGADPLVFSHGQEKGPIAIRLSDEAKWQPTPTHYLRIPR